MNDLQKYFENNQNNLIHKWSNYFDIYERHFSRFRGAEVHVLEIGVNHGGSLQMWKNYFGPKSRIYGVDVNPECKKLEEEQIKIIIGDQSDRFFLKNLKSIVPKVDILIDDGSHIVQHQVITFEELFCFVEPNGVYVCEDIHTSYWKGYGGGVKRKGTFVEYSKDIVDQINAWFSRDPRKLSITNLTRSLYSVTFYSGMIVFEKRPMQQPFDYSTGVARVQPFALPKKKKSLYATIKKLFK